MTDADLIAAFVAWRDDIDSEPFAHESEWTAPTVYVPATPGQGVGCPIVLMAGAVAFLALLVVVSQIVMAVTR